jgi:antitoxin CptB
MNGAPTLTATSPVSLPPMGASADLGAARRSADGPLLGERDMSKLRWRARRGLLECDLLVQRFFKLHGEQLTQNQAHGFTTLMNLDDPDLLDLLLKRREPEHDANPALHADNVRSVLALMRVG